MTRAAIALAAMAAGAVATLAALLWASSRDLREPWSWPVPEGDDGIQPPDPWTSDNLAPAWEPDPPYLEALPLARMRAAYGGRTIGGT